MPAHLVTRHSGQRCPGSPTLSLPRPRLSQRKSPETYSTKTRTDLSEPLSMPQEPIQSWLPPWKAHLQGKVESNASYKTVLHHRRMLTLCAIIIDDVTDGQVKGEDAWNVKAVQKHARRLLYVLARDLQDRAGKSLIKAITLSPGSYVVLAKICERSKFRDLQRYSAVTGMRVAYMA
ncbi:hypothetical protein EV421DRAFT_1445881 [Armillaria borealis]|uniref:Uncharacterized protein n=1 Tax=Armillaria borealis TaxID=47425 RepID=A0AA39MGT9_9AGAR|nr:hypothetical protein EV421DRAFT_1445881 [Armillaria borealis]